MNLKEFVAESLKEVMDGIVEAQQYAQDKGAEICPPLIATGDKKVLVYKSETSEGKVSWVNYDIAVTAEEIDKSGGGGKLSIKVASLVNVEGGGEATVTEKASSLSRMQFKIAVVWPHQGNNIT